MNRRDCLRLGFAVPALLVGGAGCGRNGNEFQVSGTVTFDGKPVRKGFITFSPNVEKGNSGPGGGAQIRDGQFTTARGKGVVGGSYWVKIVGYDGAPFSESGEQVEDGKSLFPPYEFEMDFPKESVTKEFVVPLKPPPLKKKGPPNAHPDI